MSNKIKNSLKDLMVSDKGRTIFVVVGLVAIVLIFFSSNFGKQDDTNVGSFDTSDYQAVLTDEIKDMVESVEGAGDVKVLLTLQNSYEYVYLDDGKTLQKVNEPSIRGVVVACDGGDSAVVSERITELLTTVLGISRTEVCISKLT